MKKILMIILLAVGTVSTSYAQLNLGLKINWNISKFLIHNVDANQEIYNRGVYDIKALTLGGGIIANYKFKKNFSIQSELIYSSINTFFGKVEYYTNKYGERDAVVNNFYVQMHYLEIPLLAKISFGHKATFDILAGAYVGYLLSGKQSTRNGQLNMLVDTIHDPFYGPVQKSIDYPTQNARTDYTSFNVGLLFGCGVTMDDRIIIECRLNSGLININKSGPEKINTLQGQLSVGYYLFRQKKKTQTSD